MIDKIYRARLDSATIAAKRELWNVLVEQFLQRHVPTDAAVADTASSSTPSGARRST